METVNCNSNICKDCLVCSFKSNFSEFELKVWNVLNHTDKRMARNIGSDDRYEYMKQKGKEKI